MYDGQEQEQRDYEMGISSEWQNAYAISQLNREPDDSQIIQDLVTIGRFVLYSEYPVNCRLTDATLGYDKTYIADFATREEAEAAMTSKSDYELEWLFIEPRKKPEPVVINYDDIPF